MQGSLVYNSTGYEIRLDRQLASGGEGVIWQTDVPQIVAKIYHSPEKQQFEKLQAMVSTPPVDPTLSHNHISIAWPQDIISDASGKQIGFLMPRVSGSLTLNNVYLPKLRKKKAAGFNWYYLYVAALNIASIIESLHARKYVIGDVKTDNFLVNEKALVSITDTDSFQVISKQGYFRCTVGSEGFTPPELIGKNLAEVDRTEEHDRFGLAVLIYLLLMGQHPYRTEWDEGQEPLPLDDAVLKGIWPYGFKKSRLSSLGVPLTILPLTLQQGFLKAFNEGHLNPQMRPTASDWKKWLNESLLDLEACEENSNHFYTKGLEECFWCHRASVLGIDIFPPIPEDPKLEIVRHFEQALKTQDHRTILSLWESHPFLKEFEHFKKHENEIEKAKENLNALETFKQKYQKGATEEDILDLWLSDPRLAFFSMSSYEEIKGKPIREFLEGLRQRHQAYMALKDSIQEADHHYRAKNLTFPEEQSILNHYEKYHDFLEEGEEIEDDIKERIALAIERLEAWDLLLRTLKKDDKAFIEVWEKVRHLLAGLALPEKIIKKHEEADHQKQIFNIFLKHLTEHPYEDAALVELWERYVLFHQSGFAEDICFQGLTLKELVARARKRQLLLKEVQQAAEDQDLEKIAEVWDSALCEDHPGFLIYKDKVSKAQDEKEGWHKVRRAILEEDIEGLLLLWDEKYTRYAKMHNLSEKVKELLKLAYDPYVGFITPPETFSQVRVYRDFIYVSFTWPQVYLPGHPVRASSQVIISIREGCFPKDSEDVTLSIYRQGVQYESHNLGVGILLPFHGKNPYIHVWAAEPIAQESIPLGQTLALKEENFPCVNYQFVKSWKRSKEECVELAIKADYDILLPPLELVGVNGRCPMPYDKEAILLGSLQEHKLKAGVWTKVKILLDQPVVKGMSIRLYPLDKSFLNQLTFLHPHY
jgi:hypothetical protein